MKVLGIIPARGGSKRVSRKNIRLLAGKPLISYTIEAAQKSKLINRLIVSTDDQEIAEIAKKCGAEVPFLRPSGLAQDNTPDQPVFQHVLTNLKSIDGYEPEIVLNLRPTSPLKTAKTIDRVIEMINETEADIVRTMSPAEANHHPYWMYTMSKDCRAKSIFPKIEIKNYYQSQLLPKVYNHNAVVDAYTFSTVKNGNILSTENLFGLVIPNEEAMDIDQEIDLKICEILISQSGSFEK